MDVEENAVVVKACAHAGEVEWMSMARWMRWGSDAGAADDAVLRL